MHPIPGPVAILYQAALPPPVDGVQKPMKPGGYSDSGADIGFQLQAQGVPLITPVSSPDPAQILDWVFPDTAEGIQQALRLGARILWANTVVFGGHALEELTGSGIRVVGQKPARVQEYDDKWVTNELLRAHGCRVPSACLVSLRPDHGLVLLDDLTEEKLELLQLRLPLVVKPVRGRGSEGVAVASTLPELRDAARGLLSATQVVGELPQPSYGDRIVVEQFLPGTELTVTVMPPGTYRLPEGEFFMERHWCLPPVRRFNHHDGVAPYNGVVAVTRNSVTLSAEERLVDTVQVLEAQCAVAAALVGAVAPIRIDARATADGALQLFDLNMKPNLTGAGRPGRDDQDSLTTMAARGIDWSYADLLINMLRQSWTA